MILTYLKAILLGILQGITEWLPISSTGHLLLLEDLLAWETTDAFRDLFTVVIQFGSILAVVVLYFSRLCPIGRKAPGEGRAVLSLWGKVLVGCLPAAVAGFLLDDLIKEVIYGDPTVKCGVIAAALAFYGILFLIQEKRLARGQPRIETVETLTWREAFGIGCFQVLSLIPGTSRSGSTILGGRTLGVSRTAAAEFSFFLAIPIMVGASGLDLVKFFQQGNVLTPEELGLLLVGSFVAFLTSLAVIRFLMEFVRRHTFAPFGIYRLVLAGLVLGYLFCRYL